MKLTISNDVIILIAKHVVETGCTVRQCAEFFNYNKSTIHRWLTKCLKFADVALYKRVKAILSKNLSERAHRGAMAAIKNGTLFGRNQIKSK